MSSTPQSDRRSSRGRKGSDKSIEQSAASGKSNGSLGSKRGSTKEKSSNLKSALKNGSKDSIEQTSTRGTPTSRGRREDTAVIRSTPKGKNKNDTSEIAALSGRQPLKRKKSNKNLKNEVKKPRKRERSTWDKLMYQLGFAVGDIKVYDPKALEAVAALDLQPKHLKKMRRKFDRIDIDGSGSIDYDEFFEAVGEMRSPFTDKLFNLIDIDGSGTIEFDEYVRVMATYCMFTKDEIMRFCFECFDVDRSGTIDEKEFIELCKCVNNASPTFPGNFKRALEEFDVNEDGLIDYGEFINIDNRYPLIFFPAFRLQDVLQKASLGESGWVEVIQNYRHRAWVEEYKANNGGRLPPDPPMTSFLKSVFPCFYREKVHIKVGADMEKRHKQSMN